LTGPTVKLLAVVKADAYGHGLPQVARVLMQCGVDGFGVANLTEALAIRQLGGNGWPIILFGSALSFELEKLVEQNITATVSSLDEARQLNAVAAGQQRIHPIHVEIDTGMGRVGLFHETATEIIQAIAALPNLRLEGLCTHFPSADEDSVGTRRALELFLKIADCKYTRHAANSAALFNIPESHLNLVRPGLALYGIAPGLTPILSFKSRVAFVKDVAPGRTISYGQTFTAQHPMKIATIAAGYGDGFNRQLSNRAHVLIAGQRCPVVGRVTMDQIMVDVTDIGGVQSGDEVVLIGRQGTAQITATEVAAWAGTISWDILCGINKTGRVPRVYTGAHAS
jgi:alanine racemase